MFCDKKKALALTVIVANGSYVVRFDNVFAKSKRKRVEYLAKYGSPWERVAYVVAI